MNPHSTATGLSLVVATIFATLYFTNPRIQDKPVDRIVKVEVPVTNQVEKMIEVDRPIPEHYNLAIQVLSNILNAPLVTQTKGLQEIPSVAVSIYIGPKIADLLTEGTIRAKFELTLRRTGLTIDQNSKHGLILSIEGFESTVGNVVYSVKTELNEIVTAERPSRFWRVLATTWHEGAYGTVGKSKFDESTIETAEQMAEKFANDYLTSNPRPK